MAYTLPPTFTLGELITPATLNTYIRDNFGASWVGTTAGDLDYYTSAITKARLAIGNPGKTLRVNQAGTAPEWTNNDIAVKIYHLNGQSIANDTVTPFPTLEMEDFDPWGFHSGTNAYVTVPAGSFFTGMYIGGAWCYFDGHATAGKLRELSIKYDGSDMAKYSTVNDSNASATWLSVSFMVYLSAGSTIQPYVLQKSGGALNLYQSTLWLAKLV